MGSCFAIPWASAKSALLLIQWKQMLSACRERSIHPVGGGLHLLPVAVRGVPAANHHQGHHYNAQKAQCFFHKSSSFEIEVKVHASLVEQVPSLGTTFL